MLEGEAGSGELYRSYSITERIINYRSPQEGSTEESHKLQDPHRVRCILHFLQETDNSFNSANEKPSSPWTLLLSAYELLFKTTPLLFVGLAYAFAIACLSWIAIPLFMNTPIFAGLEKKKRKNYFIFKINTSKMDFQDVGWCQVLPPRGGQCGLPRDGQACYLSLLSLNKHQRWPWACVWLSHPWLEDAKDLELRISKTGVINTHLPHTADEVHYNISEYSVCY